MIKLNRFYIHKNAWQVCALVIRSKGSSTYEVQWHQLGVSATPSPINKETEVIYMHPNWWTDITDKVEIPRSKWES